jgi:hypothetical protein
LVQTAIVLLIFKSSRIIVTGVRTYADILSGFAEISEVLRPYFTQCVRGGGGRRQEHKLLRPQKAREC